MMVTQVMAVRVRETDVDAQCVPGLGDAQGALCAEVLKFGFWIHLCCMHRWFWMWTRTGFGVLGALCLNLVDWMLVHIAMKLK